MACADPQRLWAAALGELELQMTRATFDAWLRDTHCVDTDGDTLIIAAKNEYAIDWLDNRLRTVIDRTLHRLSGNGTSASFVVAPAAHSPQPATHNPTSTTAIEPEAQTAATLTILADLLRQVIDPATRQLLQQQIAALQGVEEPEDPVDVPQLDTYGKAGGGWYPISNYADTFWKPLLKQRKAFLVYTTIRAMDKTATGDWTPLQHIPIREIMQRVPCSRHTVIGTVRQGEHYPGALSILRAENIARIDVHGDARHTTYHISVVKRLPLLTPSQVRHLSDDLQAAHHEFLLAHDIDPTPWEPGF